jgi:hypothetical protein
MTNIPISWFDCPLFVFHVALSCNLLTRPSSLLFFFFWSELFSFSFVCVDTNTIALSGGAKAYVSSVGPEFWIPHEHLSLR